MDHACGVLCNRGKPLETGSAEIAKLLLAWGQGEAEALGASRWQVGRQLAVCSSDCFQPSARSRVNSRPH